MMKNVFISALAVMLLTSCVFNCNNSGIKGSGNVTREQRAVTQFSGIEVIGGSFSLFLLQGDFESVEVEIDDNLQQYVEVQNVGNELVLSNKDEVSLNPTKSNVYITLKNINLISVLGVCSLKPVNTLNCNELAINIGGVVNGELDVICNEMDVNIHGVSNVELSGQSDRFSVTMSGVGSVNAINLEANKVNVNNSGVGSVSVYAFEELSMNNSGVGSIKYAGDAEIKNLNSSGIGKIKKVERE